MIIIRKERPDDREAVGRVNRLAFGQDDEADLVERLRRGDHPSIALVAEREDQVVGHILFTPVRIVSDSGEFAAIGLAPMSVLPEYQRQGIGKELVASGLETCRVLGHEIVIVLGHPEYYPRFGFVKAAPLGICWVHEVSDEAFMVLELRDGALAGRGGIVHYLPEFDAFAE